MDIGSSLVFIDRDWKLLQQGRTIWICLWGYFTEELCGNNIDSGTKVYLSVVLLTWVWAPPTICPRVYSDWRTPALPSHLTLEHFEGPKVKGVPGFFVPYALLHKNILFFFRSNTQESVRMEFLSASDNRHADSINFCFTPDAATHTFA